MVKMKTIPFFYSVLALSLNGGFVSAAKVQCPGTFKRISAADFVKTMSPGEKRSTDVKHSYWRFNIL